MDLDQIEEYARREVRQEQFRQAVEARKEKLRKGIPLWLRIIHFIFIRRK